MWDIVPDADRIVIVIESIGYRVEELLGLFSPYPVQVLEARVEHHPAMRRQPELGTIWARDSARLLLACVPLGLELIDALVQDFQKVGIVDLGGFPIAYSCVPPSAMVSSSPSRNEDPN